MKEVQHRFGGAEKKGESLLLAAESRLKKWIVPRLPAGVQTHHLTLMTLVWSLLNLLWGYLASEDLRFMWLVSVNIVLQYITDLLDGELGRFRGTGLIKWGYYMDHFLDYVFLCSLVLAGFFICPAGLEVWYLCILALVGGFMVNSFLAFGATNEFEIYHHGVGPTEARIVLLIVNTVIIFFGTGSFTIALPVATLLLFIGLGLHTYKIHAKLWAVDMSAKDAGTLQRKDHVQ